MSEAWANRAGSRGIEQSCPAGGSLLAAVGRDYLIASALASFLQPRLSTRQQHGLVVTVPRKGYEAHREGETPRRGHGVGLEGHVLDVRADALDHAGGVGVRGIQQKNRDALPGVGDHVSGAEELRDLASHRLPHRLIGIGRRAVRPDQTDGEKVLVARGAGGFTREELMKGLLAEHPAGWIHEIGHRPLPPSCSSMYPQAANAPQMLKTIHENQKLHPNL